MEKFTSASDKKAARHLAIEDEIIRRMVAKRESFKTSLLTAPHSNTKLRKTLAKTGVAVYSLALAPAQSSGVANLCVGASVGCVSHCVGAEHNGMSRKYRRIFPGRIARTA